MPVRTLSGERLHADRHLGDLPLVPGCRCTVLAGYWCDPGANTYYQSGNLGTVLSKAVVGLPSDGSTVWARLWYLINGSWSFVDNTYTAYNPNSNKGVITNPVPNSTLPPAAASPSRGRRASALPTTGSMPEALLAATSTSSPELWAM